MRIDYHHHILPEPHYADKLLGEMDRLGFDKVVVAGLPEYFGFGLNSWMHQAVKMHPDRIIGFPWFDLGVDHPKLVDHYAEQGFAGIKFTAPHFPYNDPRAFPVYARIEELGLATLFHTGIVLVNNQMRGHNCDSARMRPIMLDGPAREFPNMNFHLAHLGVPWHDEALMLVRLHKNITADITGPHWRDHRGVEWFRNQLWFDGAWDRLIFGTDGMSSIADFATQYQKHKDLLDALEIPIESQRKFFGENAARLLRLTR